MRDFSDRKETPLTIAVDGVAASGKGAVAKRLAGYFDLAHLDTGLLYRAVGLAVLEAGGDPCDEALATKQALALKAADMLSRADDALYQKKLREEATAQAASKVSAIQPVRDALFDFQKNFVKNPPAGKRGSVLDGRDIGTVIAPEAKVKIFITASPEVRAHRRFLDVQKEDKTITEAQILADMKERDLRDTTRAVVPTKPAKDALILDTSNLTLEEVMAACLSFCAEKGLTP